MASKTTNPATNNQFEPLPPPQHRHPHPHHYQFQQHQHHQIHDHQISFRMMQSSSSSSSIPGNYLRGKDSGAYDLGELDQAFFLYLDGQADPSTVQDQRRELSRKLSLTRTHTWKFLSLFLASNLLQIQKRDFFPLTFRSFVRFSLLGHTKSMFGWFVSAASYFLWPNPCREGRGRRWSRYFHL